MPTDEYKTLCKQILKNLRLLYSDEDIHVGIDRNKRCEILNNCLYKKINQYSIPDEVINKIFNVSFVKIIGLSTTKKKCPYSSNYKDIYKDDRIILLSNFASNIDIINSILTTKNEDNYCSCRRYVNDCVNIYKDIKQIYCSSEEDKQGNNKGICNIIDNFTTVYMGYIYTRIGTDQKFPSLYSTNVTTVDTTECPLYIEEQSSSVQGNK
ncbi:hypothetical protein PVIIG_05914 [Plasmodium vivax India VII]|uniref:PIR Superfamily Protein n=1 Tax=Plasmodium vivax India VII TaxID=1077284 RepID=A0A0J9S1D7_PLAVI|nr:hypothetical protein PVIIG_05914 [Plasmodium vivax India VII]